MTEAQREAKRHRERERYRRGREAAGFPLVRGYKRQAVTGGPGNRTRRPDALGATRHTSGRWIANIYIDGRQKYLGCFKTPEEASAVYWAARQRIERATDESSREGTR